MAVVGMDRTVGRAIGGVEHLKQSVRDVLATPLGSRVMRRDYGSELRSLLDRNLDATTVVRIYGATIDALRRWEPRLAITRVELVGGAELLAQDRVELRLQAIYLPSGEAVELDGIVL